MPELDLPAPNLEVGRDHYAGRAKAWSSVRSAQLTVTTTSTNIRQLLTAEENAYTDAAVDLLFAPDGARAYFKGQIALTPYTKLKTSSVTLTAVVGTSDVDITDDGSGNLSGTNVTGTVDYDTGEWEVTWSTGAPDADSVMVVDYTEYFSFEVNDITGLWLYPAAEVRATFDGVTAPTASTGIAITEAIFLTGQPGLIGNMLLIAGSSTLIDVEVMV